AARATLDPSGGLPSAEGRAATPDGGAPLLPSGDRGAGAVRALRRLGRGRAPERYRVHHLRAPLRDPARRGEALLAPPQLRDPVGAAGRTRDPGPRRARADGAEGERLREDL